MLLLRETTMDKDDPLAFMTGLCYVSSSQQELLRRCPFALEPEEADSPLFPDDSGEFPIESTQIMMVSPPESHEECKEGANVPTDNNDVFHTPPEGSSLASSQEQHQHQHQLKQSVAVDPGGYRPVESAGNNEDSAAVDLGSDTDSGFHFGSGLVTLCNSTEIRVSEGGLPSNDGLYGSPLKKAKILELKTPRNSLIADAGKMLETLLKSAEKLKSLSEKSRTLVENSNLETPGGCLGNEAGSLIVKSTRSIERLCSLSKDKVKLDKNLVFRTSRSNLDAETFKHSIDVDKSKGSHPCLNSGLLQSYESEEILIEMNSDNRENSRECTPKRKIEFSTELLDSFQENEAVGGLSGGRLEDTSKEKVHSEAITVLNQTEGNSAKKSIDDIDKFRYVLSSGSLICERKKDDRPKHESPVSLCGKKNAGDDEMVCHGVQCTANCKELTVLDVLRILAKDCHHDPCIEKLTIFEAAKKRGLTFP